MRAATATLDLAAVRHNLAQVRLHAPSSRVVAVVKANAYGHGVAHLLPAIAGADMLGVACIEEALVLRDSGATLPILLLEGVFEADELPLCERLGFEIVVHEPGQVRMLEATSVARPLRAWLKVDSGMGRLGFRVEAAPGILERLRGCASVLPEIRLMTHFANADAAGDTMTTVQYGRFADLVAAFPGERSVANSAGVLGWPDFHGEWVRPGIMLYGASPMHGRDGPMDGLRPVMTLTTKLIAIKEVRAGDTVGYAATWQAPADGRVGIAAIGYGDGYPRHAPSGTPVLLNGRPAPLAGRVSMDMIAVDLADHPEAQRGDPVLLWGEGLPVETIAARAGTIAYELLCGVTGRVHARVVGIS